MSDTEQEIGPTYGIPLISTLPLGSGNMKQAMPSRSDLKGVIEYRQGQRVVAGYEVLLGHYTEAADEITRLRAIVDKLTMTADGVPVVPNEIYWIIKSNNHIASMRAEGVCHDNNGIYVQGKLAGRISECIFPEDMYSTKEAAEASRAKATP